VPGTGQHCPKEPSSARKGRLAWEGDTGSNASVQTSGVGHSLTHALPSQKHPRFHSSRGGICPELNSPLETDERLQRV